MPLEKPAVLRGAARLPTPVMDERLNPGVPRLANGRGVRRPRAKEQGHSRSRPNRLRPGDGNLDYHALSRGSVPFPQDLGGATNRATSCVALDAKLESVSLLRFSLFAIRAGYRGGARPLQKHERLKPRDVFQPKPDDLPPEHVHTACCVAPGDQRGALGHRTARARDGESLAFRLAIHRRRSLGEGLPRVEYLDAQSTVERVSDTKSGSLQSAAPCERLFEPTPCSRGPKTAPLGHRNAEELSSGRDVGVVSLERRDAPAEVPLLKLDERPRQRAHLHRVHSPLLHRSFEQDLLSRPVYFLLDVRPSRSLSLLRGFHL